MSMRLRPGIIAAVTALGVLFISSAALADGMEISREALEKHRDELQTQRGLAKAMQAQAAAGNLLLVSDGGSVSPMTPEEYRNLRLSKIPEAQKKAALPQIDQEIASLKVRSNTAAQSLVSDLNKEIAVVDDAIRASNAVDKNGNRRTDADKAAEDFLGADFGSSSSTPSPKPSNPNNLSPEELSESPAASDAHTRTLTVDNKPPPPPDGTPIIDASASPPPSPSPSSSPSSDGDDAAFIQGLVGVAGQIAGQSRGRGRGRNNGGGNPQSQPSPSPHPGHC